MNVLTFGDKPAPGMVQIALQKTAKEGETVNHDAACTCKDNTYMDDILDSVKTTEGAKKLTTDIVHILKNGSFKVKGWQSNTNLCNSKLDKSEIKVPQHRTEARCSEEFGIAQKIT